MRRALLALALALAACTSAGERRAHDEAELAELFRERVGSELDFAADASERAAEVRALLAQPVDEDAAVRIVLVNNPRVSAALEELGVASAELVQAGLLRNPAFTLDAYAFEAGTELELALVQPLLDLLFLSARKRVAASELAATKAAIAARLVELSFDVRRALIGVRAAERALAIEGGALEAARASRDLMLDLHRAGNVTDPELTAEELALARAGLAATEAEASRAEARETLHALLGLSSDELGWTVAGELEEDVGAGLELGDVEARALARSLDLERSREHTAAEGRAAGVAGWEAALDGIELGVAAKRDHQTGDWGVGPAVGGTLPIWDLGGTRSAAAQSKLRQSLAEHAALALEVRSAARRLRARAEAASERARSMREGELPLAARLVRETLRNYNAMQIGAFEVLLMRRQEIEAAHRYVELLRDAWLARLDLEELCAGHLNRARVAAEPEHGARESMVAIPGGH